MEQGLNELIRRGYIRIFKAEPTTQNPQNPQNSKNKGGRPSWMIEVNPIYEALRDGKKPETVQEPEDAEGDDPYGWNAPEDDPCGLTETVKPWTAGEF